MAWFGLDKLFLGYDLTAQQQQSNALDAQINNVNQALQTAGYVPPGYAEQAAADIAAGDNSTGAGDVVQSVDSEFVAGAKQGLDNVLTAPGKVVGAVGSGASTLLGGIIKAIPWWVWLGAAAALFVWMGGLELLKGRFARK
ncbi:MAG TPA: hypothetical protein VG146_01785 [Verrucomicrobiae bacterium]|nr:hypothetical protein [Verrucomicrobiae bacterium]